MEAEVTEMAPMPLANPYIPLMEAEVSFVPHDPFKVEKNQLHKHLH